MTTKKEATMNAIRNLINPFYLAHNIDSYKTCCKIVCSMIDELKRECTIVDEVLRVMCSEIECAGDCADYENASITYYWDKIKLLIPCVETVLSDTATWTDFEKANERAFEILDMDN